MLLINVENIYFNYLNSINPIINNLSFSIYKQSKIGLIGKNGQGKSTIFKILIDDIKIDSGNIYKDKNLSIGYLPQDINIDENLSLEEYLLSFNTRLLEIKIQLKNENNEQNIINLLNEYDEIDGYHYETEIVNTISHFDFSVNDLNRKIKTFSGGEKIRIALSRIIIQKPSILLLDEPSNHLDIKYITWLENYLSNSEIPFIIISHDRSFLDNTVNDIWELTTDNIKKYAGNYSDYQKQKDIQLQNQIEAYEQNQKKIKQFKTEILNRKSKATKRENYKIPRSKKKNGAICKRDSGQSKIIRREQSVMKSAKILQNKISRMLEKEEASKPFIDKKRVISIYNEEIKNRIVLKINNLSKSYNNIKLFQYFDLIVNNGDRIAICGKNGSGKSTLLKILMNYENQDEGEYNWISCAKIGYYAQEYENIDFTKTIIDEVCNDNEKLNTRARNILGMLNIKGDKVFDIIRNLSVGEKSKVVLAKILISDPNVLILDEPTNHLEITVREEFEKALINYQGTIIFVSHDRYFVDKIANKIINLENKSCDIIS